MERLSAKRIADLLADIERTLIFGEENVEMKVKVELEVANEKKPQQKERNLKRGRRKKKIVAMPTRKRSRRSKREK